jgi:dTDP-4-amino-4,6-dideoxygalactose transaminase
VIEDCAQAHGATYKERKVGSLGDIAAFSFCQDKIMTTGGEGGMVTTNNRDLWQKVWSVKDHGKSFDKVHYTEHPPGFRWLHDDFGSNYRLTEMQSAIGLVQLKKLDQWVAKRAENAAFLSKMLEEVGYLNCPEPKKEIEHAYYKRYAFLNEKKAPEGLTRDSLMAAFNEIGIPCFSGACFNISYEKAFESMTDEFEKELPNAKKLGDTSLMFLCDHTVDLPDTVPAGLTEKINKSLSKIKAV